MWKNCLGADFKKTEELTAIDKVTRLLLQLVRYINNIKKMKEMK